MKWSIKYVVVRLGWLALVIVLLTIFNLFVHLAMTRMPPLIRSILAFVGLGFLALMLLSAIWVRIKYGKPRAPLTLAELERRGLLQSEAYRAVRAFAVAEFEDEGSHYYVELDDNRVLFLSGQYLYDYEPRSDDEGLTHRRFPCTEFVVKRNLENQEVVDLICSGVAFEPDGVAPSFDRTDHEMDRYPGDGVVIVSKSYDELKLERSMKSGGPSAW